MADLKLNHDYDDVDRYDDADDNFIISQDSLGGLEAKLVGGDWLSVDPIMMMMI